jgi:ribosomal protein S18 acetylase RimI-like enzyme
MQHPLRQARPSDPFLRMRVDDAHVGKYLIDGDHVAFLRTGRKSGETWATALGDDPERIIALIESLRVHAFHGITVHDHVFEHLPPDLRGPDPGHWSLWEFSPSFATATVEDAVPTVEIDPLDRRIDPLLAHSSSAYIYAGDAKVVQWRGILDGDRLVAVGAWTPAVAGAAHLASICTDPAYRGRGLGRSITAGLTAAAADAGARGVNLEMYAGNEAAARAYRSVGFLEQGRYMSALLGGGLSSPDAEG